MPRRAVASARGALPLLEYQFLPGIDVPWTQQLRRDIAHMRLPLLEVIGRAALCRGDVQPGVAEAAGQALVDADPDSESGYWLLMEAMERSGNIAMALRVYEHLLERRRASDGAPPSHELMALAQRLLHLR
jgi:two-component SAPR family response regulator